MDVDDDLDDADAVAAAVAVADDCIYRQLCQWRYKAQHLSLSMHLPWHWVQPISLACLQWSSKCWLWVTCFEGMLETE